MDLRAYIEMETVKNDRRYTLSVPWGAPYAECHEAALECADKLLELSKEEAARAEALKQSESITPDVVEVLPNC